MDFRVLGPVGVAADDGAPLDIGPYQQRAVLALCMLAAPRPVSPNRMIDVLWEDAPPPGASNTVQAYISKLRRVFEPGRSRNTPPSILVSRPGGYALDIPETALDLARARGHAAEGRRRAAAGDHEGAGEEFRLALGEWRGEPLADFAGASWAEEEIAHLAELRLTLEEDLAEADLALGRGAALTGRLGRLVAAHPFRERLRALAAHALYQAGRQADALGVLAEGRRLLVEDLGLDPDLRSREMERRILEQDPALTPRTPAGERDSRLVGRQAEEQALREAVAADGHRVVLLAGEPGIGKTSLAEQAAEYAGARGHRVVWGRCWDGTGAPPFWPWTQAAADLAGTGGGLGALAGSGRFQLYEAFAALLNEHGRVLVVLDDLQWADASSLRLLEFLATTRLCPGLTVVATYRDTDVRPGGALEHSLGALVRLPHVRRLLLRGLGEGEIREYLGRAGGDPGRAAEMARLTAGNPFFLGEVLQLGETPGALSDVVRGRLTGLPPETEEVLTVAALLGRDAPTDILLRVVEAPEEKVLDVLDAAVRARLLAEGDGLSSRFVHDIVRDALREALPPLRRRRLHARIAEVLAERSGTRLTEIAHHYREGILSASMTGKAIGYTRRAAAQATAQFAHEAAVEHLERAIELIDRLPRSDDALRCDLLLDLAEAQAAAGMSGAAHASLEGAAEIAEGLGDDNRLARAALGLSDQIYLAMYEEVTEVERLAERIDRALASDLAEDSPWRARLMAASAFIGSTGRPVERSRELAAEAVRLARRTGDDPALSRTLIVQELLLRTGHDHDLRREAVAGIIEIGTRTGDLVTEWVGREAEHVELTARGVTGGAERTLAWLRQTAERLRLPSMISLAAWQTAVHAYLGGRSDDALAAAEESGAVYPEGALGRGDAHLRRETFRFLALRAEGRPAEALALAEEILALRPGQRPWRILRCLALTDLGRSEEARSVFAAFARDGFAAALPDLSYRFVADALSEACARLGDEAAGRVLYRRLVPHAGRLLGWSAADLCLARLALLLGDRERAGEHLRAAEAFVHRAGLRVHEPVLGELERELAG
ncbi:BTAD domain-containing putative transcriptional regulator [Planomonospora venezuelensis]|uniref:DNA-binding SARP family transcriptional activator n=1 Tax=Planomonospora venezuelensis TaxID=1999 RepID=A0A841DBP8_PLAVE|nr:BTAD domain-containing putative transcriptional regulator [Planomonospora venezuelensis]MBB5965525.1 DNA-binding SARP family transcriptional activator [Planomonospora venezuelensis]GIN03044.1 ATPase AAA [Planomonospora venezuelensis]